MVVHKEVGSLVLRCWIAAGGLLSVYGIPKKDIAGDAPAKLAFCRPFPLGIDPMLPFAPGQLLDNGVSGVSDPSIRKKPNCRGKVRCVGSVDWAD